MDALSLLEEDHDKVKALLGELDSTTERGVKTHKELFNKVQHVLDVHEEVEEAILYPALKDHPKTKELILEAYEEHHVVKMVTDEIDGVPFDDETWGAKFTVMKENLEHHIEEEEGELVKQSKQALVKHELAQLGEGMTACKQELMRQAPAA